MSYKWTCTPLAKLYEISGGVSKRRDAFGQGVPFLDFGSILKNHFVPPQLSRLVAATSQEQTRYSIRRGDVFLNRTSETPEALACTSVAVREMQGAVFSGFSKRLRPKDAEKLDPLYVAGYFRSDIFRRQIQALITAYTTRASLDNRKLEKIFIYYPAMEEQKRIGTFLFAIHEKMRVNEEMKMALKQWQSTHTLEQKWTLFDGIPTAGYDSSTIPPSLYIQKLDLIAKETPLLQKLSEEWILQEITLPIDRFFP